MLSLCTMIIIAWEACGRVGGFSTKLQQVPSYSKYPANTEAKDKPLIHFSFHYLAFMCRPLQRTKAEEDNTPQEYSE